MMVIFGTYQQKVYNAVQIEPILFNFEHVALEAIISINRPSVWTDFFPEG